MNTINVLFVCMGNICRSPTAHAVFENLVKEQKLEDRFFIDSAGTHAYHVGEQPDSRSQLTAKSRGISMKHIQARRVIESDFEHFDYIIAMDNNNLEMLNPMLQPDQRANVHLFLEFSDAWNIEEVPDPYYGGTHGFERVFDMVENASDGLLKHILNA